MQTWNYILKYTLKLSYTYISNINICYIFKTIDKLIHLQLASDFSFEQHRDLIQIQGEKIQPNPDKMRGNLRSQNKSVRMVNFRIYTHQEGSKSKRRFVEIKKREHIFAYINSKDYYIMYYLINRLQRYMMFKLLIY